MSSFVLKIIACISMFCDHIGDAFIGKLTFLNYIGRLAFPLFCFQIVQAYIHTHDIKKYILRLSLFALISQIPFMLFYHIVFDSFAINVIFTLLFGLFTILIYDKYNKSVGACFCLLLGIIAQVCQFDYGFLGVFIIFMFYVLRNKKTAMSLVFALAVLIRYSIPLLQYGLSLSYLFSNGKYSMMVYSTIFSIVPILFYNGKKGKNAKYLFYIFYPVHLLILSVISIIMI